MEGGTFAGAEGRGDCAPHRWRGRSCRVHLCTRPERLVVIEPAEADDALKLLECDAHGTLQPAVQQRATRCSSESGRSRATVCEHQLRASTGFMTNLLMTQSSERIRSEASGVHGEEEQGRQ